MNDMNNKDIFENDLDLYLHLYCEENNIQDMKKEPQSVWNSCLRYIYKHVFKDKNILKQKQLYKTDDRVQYTNYNSYDYDLVLYVLEIYIYDMCMKYDKDVSIVGFSTLTDIDISTIKKWGNGSTKLSEASFAIYEKLKIFGEESLVNKLSTGKKHPVGPLAILNHCYQWNESADWREQTRQAALPTSELPKLGVMFEKTVQPAQNAVENVTNTVYTVEND